eukprot:TRINITY_DN30993_c0_g1_i1.p1 TRINITY_DN30993_c0_g1~~TRINITY_DN30993_c0_g1_i1.p1  ORF type:complete len:117 (-),score=5.98 TRINITY_DN30993_c0_g1_i1:1989-2339(-)
MNLVTTGPKKSREHSIKWMQEISNSTTEIDITWNTERMMEMESTPPTYFKREMNFLSKYITRCSSLIEPILFHTQSSPPIKIALERVNVLEFSSYARVLIFHQSKRCSISQSRLPK